MNMSLGFSKARCDATGQLEATHLQTYSLAYLAVQCYQMLLARLKSHLPSAPLA